MSSALLALLSQPVPTVDTRKGLIITNLQNDFLSGGKLPVNIPLDYFEKLERFVKAFREFGDVIWVRSEFEADREVNGGYDNGNAVMIVVPDEVTNVEANEDNNRESSTSAKRPKVAVEETAGKVTTNKDLGHGDLAQRGVDEELFLTNKTTKPACCLPGSVGAEFAPQVQRMINPAKDLVITSTHYSAFGSNSLVMTLRMKLITELFICGGPTNLSVYATAIDSARYAFPITLVDDLLVSRNAERHIVSISHLQDMIEADLLTSEETIDILRRPASPAPDDGHEDVHGTEHRDLANDAGEEDMPFEGALEVDEGEADGDEWMPDLGGSQLGSSHLHETLQGLRFTSPSARSAFENAPGRSRYFSASATSQSSGFMNAAPNGELTGRHGLIGQSDERLPDESTEKLTESQLTETSLNKLDESSREVTVESWLADSQEVKRPRVASDNSKSGVAGQRGSSNEKTVNVKSKMTKKSHGAKESVVQPLFGVDKEAQSAGSCIVYDLLPLDFAETIFAKLKEEVKWERMLHQTGEAPRLVSCQGSVDDDESMPLYRHPSDQTLPTRAWTSAVDQVRKAAEKAVGHRLNHALIQMYRGGTDFISEHSDKTLDIVKDSYIVNVSFGAQRTMRLRTKRGAGLESEKASAARTTYRVPMPHNSMIKMSLATNAEYLHSINADKRPSVELTEAEKAFDGHRISLTFRNIGTFLNRDSSRIWGQGATAKVRDKAAAVINGDEAESVKLIKAFGAENQASTIQWDSIYGDGFDVLHLK